MRRCLILPALVVSLLISPGSFSQARRQVLDARRIFITSSFDCDVFWANRRIAVLKKGTRARIVGSTKKWILVRFWGRGRYIIGWIRR